MESLRSGWQIKLLMPWTACRILGEPSLSASLSFGVRDNGVATDNSYHFTVGLSTICFLLHCLRILANSYKLKVEATDKAQSPSKYEKLMALGVNYLYRYGTLIVFANYLMEMREENNLMEGFVVWLEQRREIRAILRKRSLD